MFYLVKVTNNSSSDNFDIVKFKLKRFARQKIVFYTLKPSDKILEKYIKKNYNLDLKSMCYLLIKNLRFISSKDGIVVKFKNDEETKIARLITYGDGTMIGSSILRDIFRKD